MNGGGRQGWAQDAVPSATPRLDSGALKDFFGGDIAIMDPRYNTPITSETLEDGYYLRDPKLTKFLVQASVNGEGWPMTLAPLQVMEMNQRIDVLEWQLSAARPTPEGAVPDLVQYQESSITTKMIRAGLGAEMKADFMNRPEGKQIFAQAVQQVASGFWLLVKLQVSAKALGSKQHWHLWAAENGLPSSTIVDASRKEREMFGALQKLPKGLYAIHHEASQILALGNVVPNMIVLPDNTFNMLALAPAETEAFRRGEATVNARLALGGKSMMNIFPGVTMFEDPIYRANNLPAEEISPFVRTTMTGEYFLLNHEYYDPKCDDSCAEKQISTQVVDLAKDRWATLSMRDIIEGNLDMRWNMENGDLNQEYHDSLLQNISAIALSLGVKETGQDVDPFIWTASDGSYNKARHWGDVNKTYLSVDRIENMAASLARKTSTEFSENDFRDISSLLQLSEELSNPVEIASDPRVQGLFAAISFLNGREVGARQQSGYLAANPYGVPDLPQMPTVPGANAANARIETAPNGVIRLLRKTVAYPAGRTFSVFHTETAPRGETARQIYYFVPDEYTTVEQAAELLGNGAGGGSALAPVSLPIRPYGYGSLPGLRYLASFGKQQNPAYAAWKNIFEAAARGVSAFDKFARVFQRVFPRTPLTEVSRLPAFFRSSSEDLDRATMIWISVVARSQYPFHVRVWQGAAGAIGIPPLGNTGRVAWVSSVHYENGARVPITGDLADAGPGRATFTAAAIGKTNDNIDGIFRVVNDATRETFGDLMTGIIQSNHCPVDIRKALTSAKAYSDLNESFVKTFGSIFTKLYRDDLRIAVSDQAPLAGLELLTLLYVISNPLIIPAIAEDQGDGNLTTLRRMQFIKSIAVMIEKGSHPFTRSLRLDDIQNLMRGISITSRDVVEIPEVSVPRNANADALRAVDIEAAWTNSRLILNQEIWKNLLNSDAGSYLQKSIIRPSNPINPENPLLGNFALYLANGINVDTQKMLKENVEAFSRASHDMRRKCDPAVQAFSMFHESWFDSPRERAAINNRVQALTDATGAFKNRDISTYLSQNLRDIALFDVASPVLGDRPGTDALNLLVQRRWLLWRLDELERVTNNTHVRWFARGLLWAYVHRDNVMALLREGISAWFDCFLIFRPFIQQDMGTGMWAQGGSQTAITGYNYGAATMQLDALHDRWVYKYTTWVTCEIINEANIHLMHDIVFKRYIGGRDTVAYKDPLQFQSSNPDLCKASIFVLNMGGELKREQLPNPLSLTGVLSQHDFPFNIANSELQFARERLQLPTWFYINLWRWHELNTNRPLVDRYSFAAQKRSNRINEVMWSGDQRYYNSADRKYSDKHIGTSHWSGMEPPLLSVVNGSTLYSNSLLRSSVIKD